MERLCQYKIMFDYARSIREEEIIAKAACLSCDGTNEICDKYSSKNRDIVIAEYNVEFGSDSGLDVEIR